MGMCECACLCMCVGVCVYVYGDRQINRAREREGEELHEDGKIGWSNYI